MFFLQETTEHARSPHSHREYSVEELSVVEEQQHATNVRVQDSGRGTIDFTALSRYLAGSREPSHDKDSSSEDKRKSFDKSSSALETDLVFANEPIPR